MGIAEKNNVWPQKNLLLFRGNYEGNSSTPDASWFWIEKYYLTKNSMYFFRTFVESVLKYRAIKATVLPRLSFDPKISINHK